MESSTNGNHATPSKQAKQEDRATPGGRRPGTPFRYIDESLYDEKDPRLRAITIEDIKHTRELAAVKGDDFKRNKTKRKRSFRSGQISTTVNSIMLASDSSE